MIWSVEWKIFVLTTLYFIWFFILMKKRFCEIYIQKSSRNRCFIEGMHGLYYQFSFFCIIRYIIFQFKQNIFDCKHELFLYSVVWGKNIKYITRTPPYKIHANILGLFSISSREGRWTPTLPAWHMWFVLCPVWLSMFERLLAGDKCLQIELA